MTKWDPCPSLSILHVQETWGQDPIVGPLYDELAYLGDKDADGLDNDYLMFTGMGYGSQLETCDPSVLLIGHPDLVDSVLLSLWLDEMVHDHDEIVLGG